MSVDEIKKGITKLSAKERARIRAWFEKMDADPWDRQIERDIKEGKLDKLAEEAIAEHKAGLSRKL